MNIRPVLRLLSSVFILFTLTAFSQDDLFITVSSPAEGGGRIPTQPALPAQADKKLVVPPTPPVVQPASRKDDGRAGREQGLLRDPFWPIGYFPESWRKSAVVRDGAVVDELGWRAASTKLKISGTSSLDGKTVAIINGVLKSPGDQVEVQHEGKAYQWQILGIDDNGQIQLKKLGIK